MKFLKPDLVDSQALDDAALSYTSPAITKPFKLEEVTLQADAAITETITITRISGSYVLPDGTTKSSSYDSVMRSVGIVAGTSYVFTASDERNFQPGEQIKVQCTNANKAGQTVYISVKRSELR